MKIKNLILLMLLSLNCSIASDDGDSETEIEGGKGKSYNRGLATRRDISVSSSFDASDLTRKSKASSKVKGIGFTSPGLTASKAEITPDELTDYISRNTSLQLKYQQALLKTLKQHRSTETDQRGIRSELQAVQEDNERKSVEITTLRKTQSEHFQLKMKVKELEANSDSNQSFLDSLKQSLEDVTEAKIRLQQEISQLEIRNAYLESNSQDQQKLIQQIDLLRGRVEEDDDGEDDVDVMFGFEADRMSNSTVARSIARSNAFTTGQSSRKAMLLSNITHREGSVKHREGSIKPPRPVARNLDGFFESITTHRPDLFNIHRKASDLFTGVTDRRTFVLETARGMSDTSKATLQTALTSISVNFFSSKGKPELSGDAKKKVKSFKDALPSYLSGADLEFATRCVDHVITYFLTQQQKDTRITLDDLYDIQKSSTGYTLTNSAVQNKLFMISSGSMRENIIFQLFTNSDSATSSDTLSRYWADTAYRFSTPQSQSGSFAKTDL
jgi:hypothetical protein